jgi:hypothetical protein
VLKLVTHLVFGAGSGVVQLPTLQQKLGRHISLPRTILVPTIMRMLMAKRMLYSLKGTVRCGVKETVMCKKEGNVWFASDGADSVSRHGVIGTKEISRYTDKIYVNNFRHLARKIRRSKSGAQDQVQRDVLRWGPGLSPT